MARCRRSTSQPENRRKCGRIAGKNRIVRHADEPWTAEHFSLGNPDGPGQDDLPALLRRVADELEQLGHVDVQDLVLHPETNEFGDCHSMTVYFHRRTTLRSVT